MPFRGAMLDFKSILLQIIKKCEKWLNYWRKANLKKIQIYKISYLNYLILLAYYLF